MLGANPLFLASWRGFQNVREAKTQEHFPMRDIQTQQKQRLSRCGVELLSFFLGKVCVSTYSSQKKGRKAFALLPCVWGLFCEKLNESHHLCDLSFAQLRQWVVRNFENLCVHALAFRLRLRLRLWLVCLCESHCDNLRAVCTFVQSVNRPCVASDPALRFALTITPCLEGRVDGFEFDLASVICVHDVLD